MPILTKDEIIQKSDDLKKRIFKYKTLINIYDRVKLQYYENQLNELILKHPEIEEWEWMGWP